AHDADRRDDASLAREHTRHDFGENKAWNPVNGARLRISGSSRPAATMGNCRTRVPASFASFASIWSTAPLPEPEKKWIERRLSATSISQTLVTSAVRSCAWSASVAVGFNRRIAMCCMESSLDLPGSDTRVDGSIDQQLPTSGRGEVKLNEVPVVALDLDDRSHGDFLAHEILTEQTLVCKGTGQLDTGRGFGEPRAAVEHQVRVEGVEGHPLVT